jgi:hypothetical protein
MGYNLNKKNKKSGSLSSRFMIFNFNSLPLSADVPVLDCGSREVEVLD